MEQIKQLEIEISDLESEKGSLQSRKRIPLGQIEELEEKIQTRKKFMEAIIKNIETNHEYVNKQEQKLLANIVHESNIPIRPRRQ